MAGRQDEEFELVLGNKQLLSLFFVVVVFFAAFFSVGYTVGYNHGEDARTTPQIARDDPAAAPDDRSVRLPETLLADPAKPEQKLAPAQVAAKPAPTAAPKPKPVAPAKKPEPQPTKAQAAPAKPAAKPAAPPPRTAAVGGATYQLQVAALRVRQDADMLAGKLQDKGYPATVTGPNGGWHRVVVGPFASSEAAANYKQRLSQDGFAPMLRRL